FAQLAQATLHALGIYQAVQLAEVQAEQVERANLRGIGFGGSDADFRPGIDIDYAVALAVDRRARHIDDGDDLQAAAARLAHAGQRVGGLAALRDGDDQRVGR